MIHIVSTTCKTLNDSKLLAGKIVNQKLAACVQITPNIKSFYTWENKSCSESEFLLNCKTTKSKLEDLENFINHNHPYDTPQFISIKCSYVSEKYSKWIEDSLK